MNECHSFTIAAFLVLQCEPQAKIAHLKAVSHRYIEFQQYPFFFRPIYTGPLIKQVRVENGEIQKNLKTNEEIEM